MDTAERRGTETANIWRVIACAIALSCIYATRSDAAVSCDNPDNLCRGNPCVTRRMEVASPCEVDFGNRVLVIGGALTVPNGGQLTLKAGFIDVRRAIIGRHIGAYDRDGASIDLEATGTLSVNWRVEASGRATPGSISLTAGQNIQLRAPLRAASRGINPGASGGKITIKAGGRIDAVGRARMRAEGAINTTGGEIKLDGARGVTLHNKLGVDGATGGSVSVVSLNGDILVTDRISASGSTDGGGTVSLVAVGGRVTTLQNIDGNGMTDGGSVVLIGGKDLTTFGVLRARGGSGAGGVIALASNQNIVSYDALYADGGGGGQISLLSSFGGVRTQGPLITDGSSGNGGSIAVTGGDDVLISGEMSADGRGFGGEIGVAGFTVQLDNRGHLFARGITGGTVSLRGSTVRVDAGAKVLVDGNQPGGSITLAATEGDLTLSGDFHARGHSGGRIEGQAAHSVHADGDFDTDGNGCISLSGTSVDVSGGVFDVPLMSSCP